MKKLSISLLILLPFLANAQYRYSITGTLMQREPSARSEAMGKAFVSVDGDLSAAFSNPAAISTIQGAELAGSYSDVHDWNADFLHYSAGFRLNRYLQFAFSSHQFTLKDVSDAFGNIFDATTAKYCLTIASEPMPGLLIGANAGNFSIGLPIDDPADGWYADFGVIKKFDLFKNETSSHGFNLAASVSNFTAAHIEGEMSDSLNTNNFDEEMPVISKFGANYRYSLDKKFLIDKLNTLDVLAQVEYQDLLNSKYNSAIRCGAEVLLLELLALRAGYYTEKVYDHDLPEYNKSEISDFSWGLGLQVPLYKLTNIPLRLNIDYVSLPEVSGTKKPDHQYHFNTYSFRLSWIPGRSN